MIELLEQLLRPSIGLLLLERILGYVLPLAQTLLASIVTLRIGWLALVGLTSDASLMPLWARTGSIIVKAVIIGWILSAWRELASLIVQEGPLIASAITGVSATPERLATRMVALVASFGEGGVLGLLDVLMSSTAPDSGRQTATATESMFGLMGAIGMLLTQVVAAVIAVMIAVPQLLLAICAGIGPLALAASIGEGPLASELFEGWAETTATALLALPVLAVLVAFLGNIPIPTPTLTPGSNATSMDALATFASDFAALLLIGQLMLIVLPIASGLIQGRPTGARGFVTLVLAACLLPIRAFRATWALRSRA